MSEVDKMTNEHRNDSANEKAIKFWKNFYALINNARKKDEILDAYHDSKDWTAFLKENIRSMLENKKSQDESIEDKYQYNGLQVSNEYFRVDITGWNLNNEQHPNWGKKTYYANKINNEIFYEHCWNLELAIEYENDSRDWMDEVIKLCHIKCGLKVVIGYENSKTREALDERKLELAAKHIGHLKYGSRLDSNEEFLIILGASNLKYKPEGIDELGFEPYVFVNGKDSEPGKFVSLLDKGK